MVLYIVIKNERLVCTTTKAKTNWYRPWGDTGSFKREFYRTTTATDAQPSRLNTIDTLFRNQRPHHAPSARSLFGGKRLSSPSERVVEETTYTSWLSSAMADVESGGRRSPKLNIERKMANYWLSKRERAPTKGAIFQGKLVCRLSPRVPEINGSFVFTMLDRTALTLQGLFVLVIQIWRCLLKRCPDV